MCSCASPSAPANVVDPDQRLTDTRVGHRVHRRTTPSPAPSPRSARTLGDDAREPILHRDHPPPRLPIDGPGRTAGSAACGAQVYPSSPRRRRPVSQTTNAAPTPGLAAFTEADAEFFFGREDEVCSCGARSRSRRLLAVIGPSGVGKSSFLRAGSDPGSTRRAGEFWSATPGEAPFAALARALAPEFRRRRRSALQGD